MSARPSQPCLAQLLPAGSPADQPSTRHRPRRSARLLRRATFAAIVAASSGLWPLAAAPLAFAQPADGGAISAPGEIENSKFRSEGVITRATFVRALPSEQLYATMRLEKGARVTVVGGKADWLKIVPPDGSFSFVNKALVKRQGNGKQGVVTAAYAFVKAGSSLAEVMWVNQGKLNANDTIEILAETDQYYKIRPPAGAYLYVPKDTVAAQPPAGAVAGAEPVKADPAAGAKPATTDKPATPDRSVPAGGTAVAPPGSVTPPPVPVVPTPPVAVAPATPPATANPGGPVTTVTPTEPGGAPASPGVPTPPAGAPAEPPEAAGPATGPAEASTTPPRPPLNAAEAVAQLQALETKFVEASQQPLSDQPLEELSAAYEQVGAATGLNDSAKRIVEIRVATLKVRAEARGQLKQAMAQRQADQQKIDARRAERQELEDQFKKVELQRYAAVGTLRVSSLQVARTTLYRLTDPQTGRTLAYVWGTDPKVAGLVDRFVGVKGPVSTDPRLQFKVINPTDAEAVDPAKANTGYVADLVPPSVGPKTATTITPEQ